MNLPQRLRDPDFSELALALLFCLLACLPLSRESVRLEQVEDLRQALTDPRWSKSQAVQTDVRWIPALLALIALAVVNLIRPLAGGGPALRRFHLLIRHFKTKENP